MLCKCIKDTTIKNIIVGNVYKIYKKDFDTYGLIYNETDTTFQEIFGNTKWFLEHFIKVKSN